MEKTPDDKPQIAAALIKQRQQEVNAAQANLAIAQANLAKAEKDKPKVTQPPFYPKPPKRTRISATQICSQITPEQASKALKKLGQ